MIITATSIYYESNGHKHRFNFKFQKIFHEAVLFNMHFLANRINHILSNNNKENVYILDKIHTVMFLAITINNINFP